MSQDCLIVVIPANLDLDELYKRVRPDFAPNMDKAKYILGLITEITLKDKRLHDINGYVPINSKRVKNMVLDYKNYLNYFMKAGILSCDEDYSPGKKCKGYKFTDQYATSECNALSIYKESIVNKYYDRAGSIPLLDKWLSGLTIDLDGAIKHIAQELKEGTITEGGHAQRLLTIHQINNGDFWSIQDSTGNRYHSNLTCCARTLRQFIKYQGQTIIEIDVGACQPYLTTSYFTNITSTLMCPLIYPHKGVGAWGEDVNHYLHLLERGEFYTYFQEELNSKLGQNYSRDETKEVVLKCMFDRPQSKFPEKELYTELFPTVTKVFNSIKTPNFKKLVIDLQIFESDIILNRVCPKIAKTSAHTPLLTIHDSICTTEPFMGLIADTLKLELQKATGIKPKLSINKWEN